jgi:hypothetical protein
VLNTIRSAFSTACVVCKHSTIQVTGTRDHQRVAIVPVIRELEAVNHFGTVKTFECGKCGHKWEETVERKTA